MNSPASARRIPYPHLGALECLGPLRARGLLGRVLEFELFDGV